MNPEALITAVKQHPQYHRAGMILCHNGVVRETSADRKKNIDELSVKVDHERLAELVARHKAMVGIIDIQVEIAEDRPLKVGDDIMVLVVAGDIRQNVLSAMTSLLDAIKTQVVKKTERSV